MAMLAGRTIGLFDSAKLQFVGAARGEMAGMPAEQMPKSRGFQ